MFARHFTKQQIAQAKSKKHLIRWTPSHKPVAQVVVKVRGETVWIMPAPGVVDPYNPEGTPLSLNRTCSANLMAGEYAETGRSQCQT
jgi:hypothetical protein